MSHVATVSIEIKSLAALKKACAAIGLEFKENQKSYKWYGSWVQDYHGANAAYKNGINPKDYGKCSHAIGIPGNKQAYEIGVVEKDGKFVLVWDFFSGGYGLEKIAGKNCQNLTKAYSAEVAKDHMRLKGYSLSSTKTLSDGTTEMVFNSY